MIQKLTLSEIKLLGITHFYGVLKGNSNVIESFKLEKVIEFKYWQTNGEFWEDVHEIYFRDNVKYLFVLEDSDE